MLKVGCFKPTLLPWLQPAKWNCRLANCYSVITHLWGSRVTRSMHGMFGASVSLASLSCVALAARARSILHSALAAQSGVCSLCCAISAWRRDLSRSRRCFSFSSVNCTVLQELLWEDDGSIRKLLDNTIISNLHVAAIDLKFTITTECLGYLQINVFTVRRTEHTYIHIYRQGSRTTRQCGARSRSPQLS